MSRIATIQKRSLLTLCTTTIALGILSSTATAQLRVATYNVAQLEGNHTELQKVFQSLAADPEPNTGLVRVPDVYVVQEVSSSTKTTVLNYLNSTAPEGITYDAATFTVNGGGGENALFYRTDTIVEFISGHADITNHDGPRATDRWKLALGYAPEITLYVYGSHFKADHGFEDERLSEANAIRNNADALGDGQYILYCGDWNTYSSAEPAFQRFFDNGNGKAVDPVFGKLFPYLSHSQSPYDGSGGNLTGGGIDDRFDFQLMTEEVDDSIGFDTLPGSYRTFGNDGDHYNRPANDGYNEYFTADEQWKADAIAKASDHMPVVVDYIIPAEVFSLEVDPLTGGQSGQFRASNATPNQNVYFVYSLAGLGNTWASQLNVWLRLYQPTLAGSDRADGSGNAVLNVNVPQNASGLSVWFQAAQSGKTTDVVYRMIE